MKFLFMILIHRKNKSLKGKYRQFGDKNLYWNENLYNSSTYNSESL